MSNQSPTVRGIAPAAAPAPAASADNSAQLDAMAQMLANMQSQLLAAQEEARLAKELAAQKSAPKALTIKVSEKGGLCVYGLNSRFPVTLYANQWERLLDHAPAIREAIKANSSKLSRK